MQNTLKIKPTSGVSGTGSYVYGAEVTVNKCRIENGLFETVNSKGEEIKSKTHIVTFETELKENSLITEIDGVVLPKPLKVVADRDTPAINYNATLYECFL